MGSSPETVSQTSGYVPTAGEQPLINDSYQQMMSLFQNPQAMYPNQTFIGASPYTQQGIEGLAGAAGQQYGMQQPMMDTWTRGLNASDVANNPYVNSMMDVNAQKSNQNLSNNVMPGLQQGQVVAGGMNSARQGLAQGAAAGMAQQGVDWANSNLQSQAYGQGLAQENAMLSQAPNMQNAFTAPWETIGQAGSGVEFYQQKALEDAMARWGFSGDQANSMLNNLIGQLGNMQYGTTAGEKVNPNYESPLTSVAKIGAGLGSSALRGGFFS